MSWPAGPLPLSVSVRLTARSCPHAAATTQRRGLASGTARRRVAGHWEGQDHSMDLFGAASTFGGLLGRWVDRRRLEVVASTVATWSPTAGPKNYFQLEIRALGRATSIRSVEFLATPRVNVSHGWGPDDDPFTIERLAQTPALPFDQPRIEEEGVVRWLYGLSFDGEVRPGGRMFAVRAKVTTSRKREFVTNEVALFVGAPPEEHSRVFREWQEETGRHGIDTRA